MSLFIIEKAIKVLSLAAKSCTGGSGKMESKIKYLILVLVTLTYLTHSLAFAGQAEYNFMRLWPEGPVFRYPTGIVLSNAGDIYVADTENNCIQKLSSDGTFQIKWGTRGNNDGQFKSPEGIAVDSFGNIYVADTGNCRIQKFTSGGTFLTKWGIYGSDDGQFDHPMDVKVDNFGNVYVVDSDSPMIVNTKNQRIQKFTSDGVFVAKWGIYGSEDGQFNHPSGVAVDLMGNIYVADARNKRIQKFASNGSFLIKWGTSGSGDGQFQIPRGIAIDKSGNVYVADAANNLIQKFTQDGRFLTKWGTRGFGNGQFDYPTGIAVDNAGHIYVADHNNHRIQKFAPDGAFIAKWGIRGLSDGQFNNPEGIAIDDAGDIFVADSGNNRIQKFTSNYAFITKWGMYGPDNGQFDYPAGIAVDNAGNIYVADSGNGRIQKFTSNGTFLTKWGMSGSGDGQFDHPMGIIVDNSGNVYVADTNNHRIQKFTSNGDFLKKWGIEGTGDGQFNYPIGVTVDSEGSIYVVDSQNERIQKFTTDGVFILKWGTQGFDDGLFSHPEGITIDSFGNIHVADTENHRIQIFTANGDFIAKYGINGSSNGEFVNPKGMTTDSFGNIYVVDTGNHRIQEFKSINPVSKPSLSITTPTKDQSFPSGTTSTTLIVSISNHNSAWAWKLNVPFPTTGSAGGNLVKTGNTATITGLQNGQIYIVYVALVDNNGNLLNPSVTSSVSFSVAFSPDFSLSAQKDTVTVKPGDSAVYLLDLSGNNGFTSNITLSVDVLPANIEAKFDPKKVSLSKSEAQKDSQLTLIVPKDLTSNTYSFIVNAISDLGVAKKLALKLIVEPKSLTATSIIVNIQPTEAIYKEELNIVGDLINKSDVQMNLSGLTIKISFISPSKKTQSFEAKTKEEGKFQLTKPFFPDEIGIWKVKAQFDGNTELGASTRESSFNTKPGKSEIIFETEKIGKLGTEIKIAGYLKPQLKGELLKLKILHPDGSSEQTDTKTNEAGTFSYPLMLDSAGDWKITVTWGGNTQYTGISQILTIPVGSENGKAIIVLGYSNPDESSDWDTSKLLAENVHRSFVRRYLDADKDIYFLSPDIKATKGADVVTSMDALEKAITDWASKQVNPLVPLYIYMLSHNMGTNFLLEYRDNQKKYLSPDQLDLWLKKLPEGTPVTIVIEACYSGNFIRTSDGKKTSLIGPNRTIITSSRGDKKSNIGAKNLYSFSKSFFSEIEANKSITEAFRNTEDFMKRIPFLSDQYPQIDSNGDGMVNTDKDFATLLTSYLPSNIVSKGLPPEIVEYTESQTLIKGNSSATIHAKVSGAEISRVFATIIPPSYKANQQVNDWSELKFPEIELTKATGKDDEYSAVYNGFNLIGSYTVIIDAENPDGTDTVQTVITVSDTKVAKGDVNGDGKVKSNDAILALRISAGLMEPTSEQRYAADMNGDGNIRSNDAILILRKVAGLLAPSMRNNTSSATITIDDIYGISGETVKALLRVYGDVSGGDLIVDYDDKVLHAINVISDSGIMLASNTNEPGKIRISFASVDNVSSILAEIEFRILSDNFSPIIINKAEIYDKYVTAIKAKVIHGRFLPRQEIPDHSDLMQNYPNPFNLETWIPYQLSEDTDVIIRIYSSNGQLIRLLNLGYKTAGFYISKDKSAYWDGRNEAGEQVSSGIYFYSIQAGRYSDTRKILMLK
jgi:sugar lactone lactonase YvrE